MRPIRMLALLLAILLLASSCGVEPPPPPAAVVLAVMLAALEDTAQPLPDGLIRFTAADPASPDRLTDTLFSALYGEAARGLLEAEEGAAAPVGDAALFLSLSLYPCELAVLRCTDGAAARMAAGLCRGRLELLERNCAAEGGTAPAVRGLVDTEGCFVLLAVCEDPEPILEAAKRTARRGK